MTPTHLLDDQISRLIGWTVLHFIWQGALVAGLLVPVLPVLRRAEQRYACLAVAMLVMLCLPMITAGLLHRQLPSVGPDAAVTASATSVVDLHPAAPWLAWVAVVWLLGASIMHTRLALHLLRAATLRRIGCSPAPREWQQRVAVLRQRLAVRAEVRVLRSWLARTPMVIGWLKPVVVIPAAALSGLTVEQLQAVIAHELAHVRRHDYLVNLLQALFEALLFFHPAVWWVSRRLRAEREYCCDDAAVSICGDPLVFARALAALADLRAAPMPAVAFNGGPLMKRIVRLVEPAALNRRGGFQGSLFMLTGALVLSWAGWSYAAVGDGSCCCCKQKAVAPNDPAVAVEHPVEAGFQQAVVDAFKARKRARVAEPGEPQDESVAERAGQGKENSPLLLRALFAQKEQMAAEAQALRQQMELLNVQRHELARRESGLSDMERGHRTEMARALEELERAQVELLRHRDELESAAAAEQGRRVAELMSGLHERVADGRRTALEAALLARRDAEQAAAMAEQERRLALEVAMATRRDQADAAELASRRRWLEEAALAAQQAESSPRRRAASPEALDAARARLEQIRSSIQEDVEKGSLSEEAAAIILQQLTPPNPRESGGR